MEQPQQITPTDQLVYSRKFHEVVRCNNYAALPNIPCPKECKIVGQLLVDHSLSNALTATADVLVVYLQQFWKTIKQFPNLPVETPKQPFIPSTTLKFIKPFLKIVGYQGLVDKIFHDVVDKVNVDYASLLWWDFIYCAQQKKEVIQYPRFTKLMIADILSKYESVPKILEEE
ncbi:hypothetical protein Tco_1080507 [Tanacetum coccineum]|uniref:Uncharacterized protein n=1 Tax=Tanacetum coccineum TaxID=301880 RepID=A0ABQ5HWI0_9ASTR